MRNTVTGKPPAVRQPVMTKLENLNLEDRFLFNEVMENREAYQAQLDVSLMEPGTVDFNRLNDSCFILIAPFDIFGRGLYRYTFEGMCKECPDLRLEDGAVRIFINTKGSNPEDFSQEFLDFMGYIRETTDRAARRTKSERIRLIHRRVKWIRTSERMGVKYMQAWEERILEREDAREEGREEGMAQSLVKTVEAAMKNFKLDLSEACKGLGTTVEEYERAKEK